MEMNDAEMVARGGDELWGDLGCIAGLDRVKEWNEVVLAFEPRIREDRIEFVDPVTQEPFFMIHKSTQRGRYIELDWHPYVTEMHPVPPIACRTLWKGNIMATAWYVTREHVGLFFLMSEMYQKYARRGWK